MNHDDFEKIVDHQLDHCKSLLVDKAKEYATDEDRLHNFKVAAAFTQSTPEEALWGFAVKHLVSISDMVANTKPTSSDMWDEKIGDAINYLILLRAVIYDRPSDDQLPYSSDFLNPTPPTIRLPYATT